MEELEKGAQTVLYFAPCLGIRSGPEWLEFAVAAQGTRTFNSTQPNFLIREPLAGRRRKNGRVRKGGDGMRGRKKIRSCRWI